MQQNAHPNNYYYYCSHIIALGKLCNLVKFYVKL